MDLTYLAVAVFGMCVLRSLPTTTAAAVPTPTPSSQQSPQVAAAAAAAEPADNSKRSRSLFHSPPQQYGLHDDVDVRYDDGTDDFPLYQLQQLQQLQQMQQMQQQGQTVEDELQRTDGDSDDDQLLSGRARPGKPDSPVYFIRLPPQPYMYVPGYGYVSQPTRLEPPPFTQRPQSPFLNLPLGYVSNAKPVGIYTLPQHPYQQQPNRQKPHRRPQFPPATPATPVHQQLDSPVYNLDKGPYVFNGRPSDVYLLQNAYDNLYSEVLQNIYP